MARQKLNTHKVDRKAKAPMVIYDDRPQSCDCGKAGEMQYTGATQVKPQKWQYTCSGCRKSVLSYTPPPGWAAEEAARVKRAREAEEDARIKQRRRLLGMGAEA